MAGAVSHRVLDAELRAAVRLRQVKLARDQLLPFTQLAMPDPDDPDDAEKSEYEVRPMHQLMADLYRDIENGEAKRVIIVTPPRHGKTQLGKSFIAHFAARHMNKNAIFATYNQPFADEQGVEVRDILQSRAVRQVFPEFGFKDDKKNPAADHLKLKQGGNIYFVGRGGSITGRGGDINFIDDLFKDDEEAESETIRNATWRWFTRTFMSRRMTKHAAIILQGTRWHEDDVIGRLTDPENPHYKERIAKRWRVIHLPAVARVWGADEDEDLLGREPYECLWPERFDLDYFEEARDMDELGFARLYQGMPTASEGIYYTREDMRLYYAGERPDLSAMRIIGASDHAVGTKQRNDFTVLLIAGVDGHGHIWLLDCIRRRMKTDQTVDSMLSLAKTWKPVIWYAEGDHIGKAIAPWLELRSRQTGVHLNVRESPIGNKDIVQRSQPMIGFARQGMLHVPYDAPWRETFINECLKLGGGATHDDCPAALAHIGRNLRTIGVGRMKSKPRRPAPRSGTAAWVISQSRRDRAAEKRAEARGGM